MKFISRIMHIPNLVIHEYPPYHWYWDLSKEDNRLFHLVGEESFVWHKNMIAKALRHYKSSNVRDKSKEHALDYIDIENCPEDLYLVYTDENGCKTFRSESTNALLTLRFVS